MVPLIKILKSPTQQVSSHQFVLENNESQIESIFVPDGGFLVSGVKQDILV